MDYLVISFRVVTIMGLLLTVTLMTGRRKIGELPVFDFLVIITLGSVVGADIAEPDVRHLPTAFAVAFIILLQYSISVLITRNRRIGKLLTFEPVIVIENGQFVKSAMKKINYSIDNVLMMLREKGVFDPNEVEFAVIESTGNLSVLKKSQNQPITPKDIKLNTDYRGLSVPLIVEGEIYDDNLNKLNLDREWLMTVLRNNGIYSPHEVFYASINTEGNLYISKGLDSIKDLHKLRH